MELIRIKGWKINFYYFRWQEQQKDNSETNIVQEQSGNSSQVFDGESKFRIFFIRLNIL